MTDQARTNYYMQSRCCERMRCACARNCAVPIVCSTCTARYEKAALMAVAGPGSLEDAVVELKLADRPVWPPAGRRHQRSTSDSAALLHFAAADADSGWPGAATRRELHFADDSAATAAAWQAPAPQLVDYRAAAQPGPGPSDAAASAGGSMPSDSRSRLRTSSMPPLDLSAITASASDAGAQPASPAREQQQKRAARQPPVQLRPQWSLDSKRPPALDVHVSARAELDTAQAQPALTTAASAPVKPDQQSALSPRAASAPQTAKRAPGRTDPFAMCAPTCPHYITAMQLLPRST